MQISPNRFYNPSVTTNNTELFSNTVNHQSYTEKTGNISITTDEGDTVTFNQFSAESIKLSSANFGSSVAQGMTFSAQAAISETMSFSVEGDLNEEELADIAKLYDSLATIADDFFSGEYDEAVNGALNIGDLGSLASLDASFRQTSVSATRLTSQHVIPADPQKLMDNFQKSSILDDHEEEFKEQDLLSARWKQITDYLDSKTREINNVSKPKEDEEMPKQMMGEIAETIQKHPRFSPFSIPIANKAVQESVAKTEMAPIEKQMHQHNFRNNFLNQFHDWLAA